MGGLAPWALAGGVDAGSEAGVSLSFVGVRCYLLDDAHTAKERRA